MILRKDQNHVLQRTQGSTMQDLFCRFHGRSDNLCCLPKRLLCKPRLFLRIEDLVRRRRKHICDRVNDELGVFALIYLSIFCQNGVHQIATGIQRNRDAGFESIFLFQSPLSAVLNRAECNCKPKRYCQRQFHPKCEIIHAIKLCLMRNPDGNAGRNRNQSGDSIYPDILRFRDFVLPSLECAKKLESGRLLYLFSDLLFQRCQLSN